MTNTTKVEGLKAILELQLRLVDEQHAEEEQQRDGAEQRESAARRGLEGSTLEGYLFPDTYRFARGLPEEQIVAAMVAEFLRVYRELVPDPDASPLSMKEHTTLASIVVRSGCVASRR